MVEAVDLDLRRAERLVEAGPGLDAHDVARVLGQLRLIVERCPLDLLPAVPATVGRVVDPFRHKADVLDEGAASATFRSCTPRHVPRIGRPRSSARSTSSSSNSSRRGRAVSTDEVWRRVQEGAGARLHCNAEQVGDVRCNRTAHGLYVGDRYATLLDEDDPRDARATADFIAAFGGMDFEDGSAGLRAVRATRAIARHPAVLRSGASWAVRLLRRLAEGCCAPAPRARRR